MVVTFLSQNSTWVLTILGIALSATITAFVITFYKAKKAPYFFLRQEAATWARRWIGVSFELALAIGGMLWLSSHGSAMTMNPNETSVPTTPLVLARISPTSTAVPATLIPSSTSPFLLAPTATATAERSSPSPTLTFLPISTATPAPAAALPIPSPTSTVTPSPTWPPPTPRVPSPAPTLEPTPTSTLEPTPTLTWTPLPTVAPSEPEATPTEPQIGAARSGSPAMSIVTFARGVDDDHQPVEAANEFDAGLDIVYAFFHYANMADGMEWGYAWHSEAGELVRETATWEWGGQGQAYIYFGPSAGYTPASYRVQLYAGDVLQAEASFTIR